MRSMILATSLLAAVSGTAAAHEKGAIYLASRTVAVGSELSFRGERLPKNGTVRMQLKGALETFTLSDIRIDSAGRFQGTLRLPPNARAGSYAVIAIASDGEVVARADVVLSPAAPPPPTAGMDHANMPGMAGMSETAAPHPTAELMNVPVNTSAVEWAAIAAIIGLSATGGLLLLARARSTG